MKTLLFFIVLILHGSVVVCKAEVKYISKQNSITFRSGPGIKHKILQMVYSGQAVEVLEENEEWARVRLDDGKEGWLMSRFLTENVPDSITSEQLRKRYEILKTKFTGLQEESKALKVAYENNIRQLNQSKQTLLEKKSAYERLKKELHQFINIRSDYSKLAANIAVQQKHLETLQNKKFKEGAIALVIALVVLLVGYVMGKVYSSNRRSSIY